MTEKVDHTPDSLQSWLQKEFGSELDLKIIFDESVLFEIVGKDDFEINLKKLESEQKVNVVSSLLMTGFIHLKFSVTEDDSSVKESNISTFSDEFVPWFEKLTEGKILIPDTNTILNRTVTSLSLMSQSELLEHIVLQIPRLVILEMERKANDSGNKKLIDKRKTFLGYAELMELKNFGSQPMKELEQETLIGFSGISGTTHTDALIRREISEAKLNDKNSQIINDYTLITSDMVNSLSAIAEGINTIYVSKIPNWENNIRKGNIFQIARLLITTSSLFEKITLSNGSKKFDIEGMWEGKNNSDWFDQKVFVTSNNN